LVFRLTCHQFLPSRMHGQCMVNQLLTVIPSLLNQNALNHANTSSCPSSVTACIRRQDGYCCIQYQVCQNVPNAFSLDIASSIADAGDIDTLCTNDYVTIPGVLMGHVQPLFYLLLFISQGHARSSSAEVDTAL